MTNQQVLNGQDAIERIRLSKKHPHYKDAVIMSKAVEEAISNGWSDIPEKWRDKWYIGCRNMMGRLFILLDITKHEAEMSFAYLEPFSVKELYLGHNFAKALWGEEKVVTIIEEEPYVGTHGEFIGSKVDYPYDEGASIEITSTAWRYHLQEMVVADDPIKYLGENI